MDNTVEAKYVMYIDTPDGRRYVTNVKWFGLFDGVQIEFGDKAKAMAVGERVSVVYNFKTTLVPA